MKIWIHDNGQQLGPFEINELPMDRITPATPVWYEGLEYWKEAGQTPVMADLFRRQASQPASEIPVQQPEPESAPAQPEPKPESAPAQPKPEPEPEPAPAAEIEIEAEATAEPEAAAAIETEELADIRVDSDVQLEDQPQFICGPQPQYNRQQYDRSVEYAQPMQQYDRPAPPRPKSYIVWSVLFTLLCCNPIGIIPIIIGSTVGSKYNNFDYAGAAKASETTQWWLAITIVTGLIMIPFSTIIML